MRFTPALAALLLAATSLSGCAPQSPEAEIKDSWIRASEYSDHVGGMTGVFAKITNPTDHVIKLVGGSAEIALMVEAHEIVDGMMRAKDGGIVIKPGETVTLEPGGLHVMLMNLSKPILPGDKVTVTLDFDGATDITLELVAKVSAGGDETYSK